jgi:hypothetical protein
VPLLSAGLRKRQQKITEVKKFVKEKQLWRCVHHLILASIVVLAFPASDSRRYHVSTLSRKGTAMLLLPLRLSFARA